MAASFFKASSMFSAVTSESFSPTATGTVFYYQQAGRQKPSLRGGSIRPHHDFIQRPRAEKQVKLSTACPVTYMGLWESRRVSISPANLSAARGNTNRHLEGSHCYNIDLQHGRVGQILRSLTEKACGSLNRPLVKTWLLELPAV